MKQDHNLLAIMLAKDVIAGRHAQAADQIAALSTQDAIAVAALTMYEAGKQGETARERARSFANYLYILAATGEPQEGAA